MRVIITEEQLKTIVESNHSSYLRWKRKNVTIRGIREVGEENDAGAMLGKGLYTAALSNREMAKKYGTVYFVVNAIPKNPKIFNTLNDWEIWFQQNVVFPISKSKGKTYPDGRDVNSITDEMMKLGYDGIIIKGREIVNFSPSENIVYFKNEQQLINYYNTVIGSDVNLINEVRVKEEERNKIYQDENIVVVAPLTHKSSCKYGSHTKWCTAIPSTDEHFNEYMEHGVLIYFIVRSPHKNTKKTEYKFAYYHPFDNLMGDDVKGWYDMSDNQLNVVENLDMNLIKFLIPDEIFKLVGDYIKTQKPIWKKRQKENKDKVYEYFVNDIHNTLNQIINDNEWFISYRTSPFDNYEFYKRMNFPHVYLSPNNSMTVMYVNKKTKDIFVQKIDYYKDLRNYEINGVKFIEPIENIYTHNKDESMVSVFDKYYPQILRTYFKVRKKDYKPDSTSCMYIPVKYVNLGDNLCGVRDTSTIHKIYNNPQTNRINIDVIDSRGSIVKNSYYSDDIGIGLKYDIEKHNPTQ